MLLYKAQILDEAGRLDEALQLMQQSKVCVCGGHPASCTLHLTRICMMFSDCLPDLDQDLDTPYPIQVPHEPAFGGV